jgi:hypothetical protein
MATIKRKSNGRIILNNGKVSCNCCGICFGVPPEEYTYAVSETQYNSFLNDSIKASISFDYKFTEFQDSRKRFKTIDLANSAGLVISGKPESETFNFRDGRCGRRLAADMGRFDAAEELYRDNVLLWREELKYLMDVFLGYSLYVNNGEYFVHIEYASFFIEEVPFPFTPGGIREFRIQIEPESENLFINNPISIQFFGITIPAYISVPGSAFYGYELLAIINASFEFV